MFKFFKRKKNETPREAVTRVFQDALELKTISSEANFFELGGDSISATVVVTALSDAGFTVPSTAVFDHPTIESLVKLIEAPKNTNQPATEREVITPKPRGPGGAARMVASLLQERLWPYERNPDPSRFQLRGEGAARLRGHLDIPALQQSLSLLVERHEVLRSSFVEENGDLYVDIHPTSQVELEVLDANGDTLEDRRSNATALISNFTSRVFDLGKPPPFRCALIKLASDEHVLAVSMHHIISDGWSMGLFVSELTTAYDALSKQNTPELSKLTYQFADYADWHRDWLASESGLASIDFWRDYLEGAQPALEVPIPAADGLRKNEFNFPVRRQQISLDAATQSAMRACAKSAQTSVHTVFLARVLDAFYRLGAPDDLPIGIMHANRSVPGTQNLIGFFATLVHLRFKHGIGGQTTDEVIGQVRDATRLIEPHSGVPIGTLIEQGIVDTLPRIFIDSVPRPKMPSIDGLTLENFPFEHPPLFAAADIALFLFDDGSDLTCLLGTNENMFSETAAAKLADTIRESLADLRS